MTSVELHHHLQELIAERATAALAGLNYNEIYMDDLRQELEPLSACPSDSHASRAPQV